MRKTIFWGFTVALIVAAGAQARILNRTELAKTLADITTVNAVIEKESDLVKQRCLNQEARKTNVNETLASFSTQTDRLNEQIRTTSSARQPHLTLLNGAKLTIANKKSEIASLESRIRNLGKPSDREKELKAELAVKTQAKKTREENLARLRSQFDSWEATGNNSRILDSAHVKLAKNPPEALLSNEQVAIAYENSFNTADNNLTTEIQQLSVRLTQISTELETINSAEERTLAQLKDDKNQAEDALKEAQRKLGQETTEVARFDLRMRQLRAQIALITGFRPVPVNSDCEILVRTE